jgi:hypothetical protein
MARLSRRARLAVLAAATGVAVVAVLEATSFSQRADRPQPSSRIVEVPHGAVSLESGTVLSGADVGIRILRDDGGRLVGSLVVRQGGVWRDVDLPVGVPQPSR